MVRRLSGVTRTALVRALALVVVLGLLLETTALAQFFPEREPTNDEITFGCSPGPVEELHHADPPLPPDPVASDRLAPRPARLIVHSGLAGNVVDGAGFNLEHALWSCRSFRRVLGRWILEPFQPEIARVDSGQLPLAPEGVPVEQLGWDVYQQLMDDPKYQPSWQMLKRLNRDNVRIMLGVWGMPGAFTDDGTRRGRLLTRHIDDYVHYYTAVVDYLVRRQGIQIWSATVMNEPDGGDGTLIDTDDFLEVARRLGPSLANYGVTLYGPDTASAANAIPYVQRLLAEPEVLAHFGAIATHEYFADHALDQLIDAVQGGGSDLPVYVTEYTSFQFGALDRGQETTNEIGQMLDSLQVYASLMNAGADAALYWDAVDYYQAGHAAITRWGILMGPDEAFEPRKRYWGFLQILPYVQRGSRVVPSTLLGAPSAGQLAVAGGAGRAGEVMVAIVNRGPPMELSLEFDGPSPPELEMYVTDVDLDNEHVGRVQLVEGAAVVNVGARSVATLVVGPAPSEDE